MEAAVARFADWLWRRYRRRFVDALGVVAFVFLVVVMALPSFMFIAFLFDLGPWDLVPAFGSAIAFLGAGIAVGVATSRQRRTIHAWGRGDPVPPVDVWNAALQAPRALTIRALVTQLPFQLTITIALVGAETHLSPLGVAMLEVELCILLAGGGMLIAVGFRLLVLPLVEEVAGLIPPGALPEQRIGSVSREPLIAVGLLVCAFSVSNASTVAGLTSTTEARLVVASLVGLALGVQAMLVYYIGFSAPTLRPIRNLIAATRRVQLGQLDPVPVTSADELGDMTTAFNQMLLGLRERAALHAAFGSYVDPGLAQRLLDSGSSMFEGEDVEVTVLFADVRDFTAYAEGVEPRDAVGHLNRLFDVIVPVLHEHGGHANHYLGDGLLAVFGAPQPLERHADAAVAAATEVQRRIRAEFGTGLRLGIGINTGPVIAGTVGGGGRHEFTVIGDTVNVAARVEQLTKDTGDPILITEATRAALSTPRPRSTKRGGFDLRGKSSAVTVHAVNPFPRSSSSRAV